MSNLVRHLEGCLGTIEGGWTHDPDGEEMPFKIVRFPRGAGPNTVSFSTLGLSDYGIASPASSKEIRHELLVIVPETLRDGPVPDLLLQVGKGALIEKKPLLRGDVLGPRGPLVPGTRMEAFYASSPVYFQDEFAYCTVAGHEIVVVWLIPISAAEACYIAGHDWEQFEDRLVEADPDLTNIYRDSLPL